MPPPKPYYGCSRWHYRLRLNRRSLQVTVGTVDIQTPQGNRREDEQFARYLIRKKLNLDRLPDGAVIYPNSDV